MAGDGTAAGQNDRYRVTFYYTDIHHSLDFELYRDTESRSQIIVNAVDFLPKQGANSSGLMIPSDAYLIQYRPSTVAPTDLYAWLGIRFKNEREGVSVSAYEGLFDSEAAAQANGVEITSQIWNPSDAVRNGYHLPLATSYETLPCFTLFFKREGKETTFLQFCIGLTPASESGRIIVVDTAVMGSIYAGTDVWRYDAGGAKRRKTAIPRLSTTRISGKCWDSGINSSCFPPAIPPTVSITWTCTPEKVPTTR